MKRRIKRLSYIITLLAKGSCIKTPTLSRELKASQKIIQTDCYVVRRMKKCEIREKWINKCITLAEKTSNILLKENLFYTEHIDDGCKFEMDKIT